MRWKTRARSLSHPHRPGTLTRADAPAVPRRDETPHAFTAGAPLWLELPETAAKGAWVLPLTGASGVTIHAPILAAVSRVKGVSPSAAVSLSASEVEDVILEYKRARARQKKHGGGAPKLRPVVTRTVSRTVPSASASGSACASEEAATPREGTPRTPEAQGNSPVSPESVAAAKAAASAALSGDRRHRRALASTASNVEQARHCSSEAGGPQPRVQGAAAAVSAAAAAASAAAAVALQSKPNMAVPVPLPLPLPLPLPPLSAQAQAQEAASQPVGVARNPYGCGAAVTALGLALASARGPPPGFSKPAAIPRSPSARGPPPGFGAAPPPASPPAVPYMPPAAREQGAPLQQRWCGVPALHRTTLMD